MLASLLYKLYLSNSDELVNRECLRGLQMANVFHSRVPRFPKENRILLCVRKCSILICGATKESPGSEKNGN